jgi:FAD/FMN-containing dehydrogenase
MEPIVEVSRRTLLAGAGLGLLWAPVGRLTLAEAAEAAAAAPGAGDCPVPPAFPGSIPLYRQRYENWAGETRVDQVWTCTPASPDDVVTLANWAHQHGYALRAQGYRHGWSPLTVTPDTGCATRVVLVDTITNLTAMSMVPGPGTAGSAAVRVQAGASLEALLGFLEAAGYGLTAVPAPGDLSVGGALAIDAHGTAVPADGESRVPGTTYGSLSNLVLTLTAVSWDASSGTYALRTFDRADPGCGALLAHLGRSFVLEVTLRVGENQRLRCLSRTDIPAAELFAAPGATGRTFAGFLAGAGRAEAIWFPFTVKPWLKVWSVRPTRPAASRPVTGPYNYPFSDNLPKPVADLAGQVASGQYQLAPLLGQAQYNASVAGLTASLSADIWGPSKNVLLYVRPTTLRVHANGYAVLVRRSDLQWVVHEFAAYYENLLHSYAARGRYPVNGAVEIRVTGLDDPTHAGVPGAAVPALSAIRPVAEQPQWDTAVWLDVLTIPGTPHLNGFFRELENFLYATFTGTRAAVRVEWSKGWAYTDQAAWTAPAVLDGRIPASFPASWASAVATLDEYDPHRVFSNAFLDRLLSS